MSQFQPKGEKFRTQDTPTAPGVAKFVAGAGGLVLEKVGEGEAELGLQGRVAHRNADQVIHDLARQLKSFYMSLPKDPRLLTTAEKEELYRQVLAALSAQGALNDNAKELARRLAGLDSGMVEGETFVSGRRGTSLENGGYATPREPANRPSSSPVAKSADMDAFMRTTRAQIQVIASRIQALIEKQAR